MFQRGFDLPTRERQEGQSPVYAATGIVGYHNVAKVKGPGVVTGRSGSLGAVSFVPEDFWPLNTALWVKEFRRSTPLTAFYLLSGLDLQSFNSGAAVPTLNRNDVHGLVIPIAPLGLLQRFDDLVGPMHALKGNLLARTTNLKQTLDLLLPKLISGELDVEHLDVETAELRA